MAVYDVTGSLNNGSGQPLAALNPVIYFILNAPALYQSTFISTIPIPIMPDSTGNYVVPLVDTVGMRPLEGDEAPYYRMRVLFRAPDMFGPGAGFTHPDFPDVKLYVPVGGGAIGDLTTARLGSGQVWVSPGRVIPEGAVSGDLIFDPISDWIDIVN